MQSLGIDKTALLFSKIKPKGDPDRASKKKLAALFLKILKVQRGKDILTLLQDNPKAKYVERSRFEAWLQGHSTAH